MKIWDDIPAWREFRKSCADGVGFVPTMGALHEGHAALIRQCRKENERCVVSIFVNPTQFNDKKDLEKYPRTVEADTVLLESLGVDDLIFPSQEALYPHGYRMRIEELDEPLMEGKHRPGFLQGVRTVVLKLLCIVYPHKAYFGEKDFEQLLTIENLVEEFFLPTEIIRCETIREASGLAMSSRNTRLSPEGQKKAAMIYKALTEAESCAAASSLLEEEGFKIDYVEEHFSRRFAAVFLEGIRLIDNVPRV